MKMRIYGLKGLEAVAFYLVNVVKSTTVFTTVGLTEGILCKCIYDLNPLISYSMFNSSLPDCDYRQNVGRVVRVISLHHDDSIDIFNSLDMGSDKFLVFLEGFHKTSNMDTVETILKDRKLIIQCITTFPSLSSLFQHGSNPPNLSGFLVTADFAAQVGEIDVPIHTDL